MMDELRSPRILVVDDDPHLAEVVGRALRLLGYEAATYRDPHEAIEALADGFAHDLLIADRRMPSLPGEEVARWAKTLRPGLPVILMSGEGARAGDAVHVDGVLRKPFSMSELASVVDRALAARQPAH